jgi:ketosteroid isomerase-like protein
MKTRNLLTLAVALAIGFVGLSNGAEEGSPRKKAEAEVKQLEEEWANALVERDAAWFKKTLADEFAMILPKGAIWDKQKYADFLKDDDETVESCKLSEVSVRVYGRAAVAVVKGRVKGKTKDGAYDEEQRWIDVYVKKQGRWQCVAAQLATVEK